MHRSQQSKDNGKLDRLWVGPAEILQHLSAGRYRVAGPAGEQDIETYRLKPYVPPLTHAAPPLHYYCNRESLVDCDKYVVEYIDKHRVKKNTGRDKRTRPEILQWRVKYKGFPKPEWREASDFVYDLNDVWLIVVSISLTSVLRM